jgi:hypothetical protein
MSWIRNVLFALAFLQHGWWVHAHASTGDEAASSLNGRGNLKPLAFMLLGPLNGEAAAFRQALPTAVNQKSSSAIKSLRTVRPNMAGFLDDDFLLSLYGTREEEFQAKQGGRTVLIYAEEEDGDSPEQIFRDYNQMSRDQDIDVVRHARLNRRFRTNHDKKLQRWKEGLRRRAIQRRAEKMMQKR